MKRFFNQFLKDQKLNLKDIIGAQTEGQKNLTTRDITVRFSLWLSGYVDDEKKEKRFVGSYHANKFMVRKFISKLTP